MPIRQKRCPALADAIAKYGLEVFKFSVLIICFDEDLDAYEREYIAKFNSMTPNGYNILEGGHCGGGFRGKKHSAESIAKIVAKNNVHFSKPEYRAKISERTRKQMASFKDKGVDFGKMVKESEKYKKALLEGRVGGAGREYTEETKKKISESLKKYFESDDANVVKVNIEEHRKIMAKVRGVKVYKYSHDGKILNEYESLKDCARKIGVLSHMTISNWINKKRKFDDDSYLSLVGPDGLAMPPETI